MSKLKPEVTAKDHAEGTADAPVTIVEYGDYECPHCGAAYPVIKKLQRKFKEQVRFIFRNFPLTEIHPFAMAAAIASEAAARQDKYWQMHDVIFENQRHLNEQGLQDMAAKAGLDMARFNEDIQDAALQEKVEADFESGMRSGVNGTPTFFVNGDKFDGGAQDLITMLEDSAE